MVNEGLCFEIESAALATGEFSVAAVIETATAARENTRAR
jgi:hypothetical protein